MNSENWFLLCADVLEDKMEFYIKHFSGDGIKEQFKFNLEISSKDNASSRSMSGVQCTPIDMNIMYAKTQGCTLEIDVKAMGKIYFCNDSIFGCKWDIKFRLFKN